MATGSGAPSTLRRAKQFLSRRVPANPLAYFPARRLLRSGLFDPWYYQLQAGDIGSPSAAAAHFLRTGAARGLLANPLTDFARTGLSPDQIVAGLRDGSARAWPLRPLISEFRITSAAPAATKHPGGPAGLYLEAAHSGAPVWPIDNMEWTRFTALRRRQGRTLKRLLSSGLFDRAFYELQTGTRFGSTRAAAWHYLEVGEALGFAPNRLFESEWYTMMSKAPPQEVMAHYLRSGKNSGWPSPHFHAPTYLSHHPDAANHPGGALGHFLSTVTDETMTVPRPDSRVEAVAWATLVSAGDAAAGGFAEQAALAAPPATTLAPWVLTGARPPAGPPEVPIAIYSDSLTWPPDAVPPTLTSVLEQTHTAWTLHIAVSEGSEVPPEVSAAAADDDRVRIVPTGATTLAARANDVIGRSEAAWIAFWEPREKWAKNALAALLGGAAPGIGSQGAVKDTDKESEVGWRTVPKTGDALLWDFPRSLSGTLLSADLLRAHPFRDEAEEHYGWDFLVRSQADLPFVPAMVSTGTKVSLSPLEADLPSSAEHVIRSSRILDWDQLAQRQRVAGRVSILMPTFRDWVMTREAVTAVLANTVDTDIEVVVVDNGSGPAVSRMLAATFAADPRFTIRRAPRNTNFGPGSNLAFAHSTGETVVFLNNDTTVLAGWLDPLLEALTEPGVLGAQPLLRYPDGSIQTAGTVFFGSHSIPSHFLANHPIEDLPPGPSLRFPAVTAACMAMSAERFAAMRGFDPGFVNGMEDVDLCLRLREAHGGEFVVRTDACVVHREGKTPGRNVHVEPNRARFFRRWDGRLPAAEPERWSQIGLQVVGYTARPSLKVTGLRGRARPMVIRPKSLVREGEAAGLPSLRWAVKIAAHGGTGGDVWGDVAFAEDLAQALRALGQEVVVDRRNAHVRPETDHLDDVALHLRGLVHCIAQPGDVTNVMWVISHPDLVTDDELSPAFQLVYSAGPQWAEEASQRSGRDVRTMLQATNPDRFRPDGTRMPGIDTLFVGRTRGVYRPIVHDAIDVGAELTVYGDGWGRFIDPSYVKAPRLPNEQLPSAYRGARIVLNDHWPDMARLGFLSNRLFDAAAAGARVVSDPVPGIAEVFGPSVQTYQSLDELKVLLHPDCEAWRDEQALLESARRIAAEHSFASRARTLLADVLDTRGIEHSLR